jgi:hypothetical protein
LKSKKSKTKQKKKDKEPYLGGLSPRARLRSDSLLRGGPHVSPFFFALTNPRVFVAARAVVAGPSQPPAEIPSR